MIIYTKYTKFARSMKWGIYLLDSQETKTVSSWTYDLEMQTGTPGTPSLLPFKPPNNQSVSPTTLAPTPLSQFRPRSKCSIVWAAILPSSSNSNMNSPVNFLLSSSPLLPPKNPVIFSAGELWLGPWRGSSSPWFFDLSHVRHRTMNCSGVYS